ncbi:hypothetical protein ACJMK2_029047 [Sinanodonta woodiana]|uniref:Anoctamin n=1 Tax=Sinanodonta woodiana TaxID=1069815 RepID=A0ABD3XAT5_SINWO
MILNWIYFQISKNVKICFVKVHAPWDVLTKYAEILNMRMPLVVRTIKKILSYFVPLLIYHFFFNKPPSCDRLVTQEEQDSFFTNAQRNRIVYEIMSRAPYCKMKFGKSTCELLYENWARWGRWYKYQPLDHIRDYFGEKIGIYFAWLGYYTTMLIPAAIVGLMCFIYGCITVFQDTLTLEVCDETKSGNLTMCPLCDKRCSYWKLKDSCTYSMATHLFDNPATVFFACFMALWASFFHELWKRKEVELEYEWDTADFEQEEETVRPEFEAQAKYLRTNPVTKLCVVIGAVFGVICYRIIITAVLYSNENFVLKSQSTLFASGTAACINLVVILLLNTVIVLEIFQVEHTHFIFAISEKHRTETAWEDAFTFKMFLFQFVNFYSSIFYIAFFKGKFIGRPGHYNYNLLGLRQEECNPAGCLIELCLQMAIIMGGKQIWGNFKEIFVAKIIKWFTSESVKKKSSTISTRWEQDYMLSEMPKLGLFYEYLEMVIQYGFVTIFVAAFPLAPLFALINNIFEIRIDAYKFVTMWRRPFAARAQDIAFTSEFIPKLVYKHFYSNETSQYYDFSLSTFNVTDFDQRSIPDDKKLELFGNITTCRYRDFRNPPGSDDQYKYTIVFWHLLAARLAFVVVFENLIVFLTWLIMYLIPDVPYAVKIQMQREKYLAKKALTYKFFINIVADVFSFGQEKTQSNFLTQPLVIAIFV